MRITKRTAAGLLSAALVLLSFGCGSKANPLHVGNERPFVHLSARPQPGDSVFYSVRLQWFASDEDGKVDYYQYAVDPPASGDTSWVRIDRNEITIFFRSSTPDTSDTEVPFKPSDVTSRDYHVFVIKAVDNEGLPSAPEWVAFTSETVAPMTQILSPGPSEQIIAITAPSVIITWRGTDPDGQLTQKPVKYKVKLASQTSIQLALNLGTSPPSAKDLQEYFSQEAPAYPGAPAFASWDSLPADTTFKQYEGLTPGQVWFFAVVAFDEAGAYEPRFNLNNNLLRFKPSTELLAPRITIFNSFFSRTQTQGQFDPNTEARVFHLEAPSDQFIPFFWEAEPAEGTVISGYRWVLDPLDGDIFNETPRENDSQTYRWSSWSLSETQTNLGPFHTAAGVDQFHRFYLEARDNVGTISLVTIELRIIKPDFDRSVLFFDDVKGNPDRTNPHPYANFPTESVLDTLLYAVGGFPDKVWDGALSKPGVFTGYFTDAAGKTVSDTLDYRFLPVAGLPLSILSHYKALVWYTQPIDAGNTGKKFSANPSGALRFINSTGELNTLAVYLSQGGKAWLFGQGVAIAVANGYVTRFTSSPAFWPYQSGGTRPDPGHILWPGDFMYDYMKVQSELDFPDFGGSGNPLSNDDNLVGATPYLPQYACPGAPWPPEGWTGTRDATCDPRVGPASSAMVPRWGSLPELTFTTEFTNWDMYGGNPLPTTVPVPYIALPNNIIEDVPDDPSDPKSPTHSESRLDTLYLYRAKAYLLRGARDNPDGKPIWVHYRSQQGWQLNWTSCPIWLFERTQLQQVAQAIMTQFGIPKNPNPSMQTGPGQINPNWTGTEGAPLP